MPLVLPEPGNAAPGGPSAGGPGLALALAGGTTSTTSLALLRPVGADTLSGLLAREAKRAKPRKKYAYRCELRCFKLLLTFCKIGRRFLTEQPQ